MPRIRRVLFATDFSKTSRRAFDAAVRLAWATGSRLTILSVTGPILPTIPEVYLDAVTSERLEREARGSANVS